MSRLLLVIGGLCIGIAILACAGVAAFLVFGGGLQNGGASGPVQGATADGVPVHDECSLLGTDPAATPADPTAPAGPDATPGNGPASSSRAAVDDLRLEYCRWEAAGVLVPVPAGWTVERVERIGTLAPGNSMGAVRMHGRGEFEEITVTIWARNVDPAPAEPVLYPNPWLTLSQMYETEVQSTREVSLAGRRAAEARGREGRRPIIVQTYFDGGRAWAFGASSDEASADLLPPLLERLAAAVRPAS